MNEKETILGTTKIDSRYRITLVQPIPELLGVKEGDLIVFIKDQEGNITLRSSQITKIRR